MMQQIATQTNDIAAGALPLDLQVEPGEGTEFSLVLQQQTQTQMSAYEKALQRAESMAMKSEAKVDKVQSCDADEIHHQDVIEGDKTHERTELESKELSTPTKKDSEINVEDELESANLPNDVEVEETQISVAQDNREKLAQILENGEDDFDYVEFVTDVKLLGEVESNIKPTPSKDIDTKIVPEINEDFYSQDVINDGIDYSKFHITQDELDEILAANNQNVENPTLKDTIKSIIAKFEATKDKNEDSVASEPDAELDIELVSGILQGVTQKDTTNNDNVVQERSALDAELLANPKAADLEIVKDAVDSKEVSKDEDSLKLNAEISAKISAEIAEADLIAPELEHKLTESEHDLAAAIKNSLEVNVPTQKETNKVSLNQLAQFDEERLEKSLANLQQRVEKVIPELSGEIKGKEFIAALQSGVKEFKEQLSQGREPGIDLQALVSESLEKSEIDLSSKALPKIEQSVSQFSAMLNLANGVQQTSQFQSSQLMAQAEAINLEKMSQSFTEGTKLAQTNANVTNFDKAVNIFKPDGQQQLAERVRWMVQGRNPAAEIRLDPPELGAMQIRINLNGDAASVNFAVQSIQAKDALDQAMPKLREMLQEQGIELGQSSVQQDSNGSQQEPGFGEEQHASQHSGSDVQGDENVANEPVIEQRIAGNTLGGIDYYA